MTETPSDDSAGKKPLVEMPGEACGVESLTKKRRAGARVAGDEE
jgi:hypothetical protein